MKITHLVIIVIAVFLITGFSNYDREEIKNYSYDVQYGELCGQGIYINGQYWNSYGAAHLNDAMLKSKSKSINMIAESKEFENLIGKSSQKAVSDIRDAPDIYQCIKSVNHIVELLKKYKIADGEQNWANLAKFLSKFSSYKEAKNYSNKLEEKDRLARLDELRKPVKVIIPGLGEPKKLEKPLIPPMSNPR